MFRRQIAHAAMACAAAVLLPAASHASPVIAAPAPDFTGTGVDGKPVNLASFKGRTVVLEWTNHDCPYVRKHYESGNIPRLQKEATGQGVVWLQVISSAPGRQGHVDAATARQLNVSRNAVPTATVLDPDGRIGRLYGAQTTPHLFIVDANGVLQYKGGIDSIATSSKDDIAKAQNHVKAALGELAAGKKISNASTRPYGCAVKYADG
jgi:hypothetical protein